LIDEYCTDQPDTFKVHFKYDLTNPIAIPEDLMYTLINKRYYIKQDGIDIFDIPEGTKEATGFYFECNTVFVKPMFTENMDFKYDAGLDMHSSCHEYTIDMWKKAYKERLKHKVVLVTGGFDPIHSGHIEYFKEAKKLGDVLVVGVNSDEWLVRKKGQQFMSLDERVNIIKNLVMVDSVITFDDSDGTAKSAIRHCLDLYPESQIIFANGGDRTKVNIPEMSLPCTVEESERLTFEFGIGGSHKMNSSSKILTEWKTPRTERKWGYYRVLHSDGPSLKVKELVVEPGKSLSMQKHKFRSEYWIVSEGTATVNCQDGEEGILETNRLEKHDEIHIPVGTWHQLANETDAPLRIVEIQYGVNCIEEDIIRI
jgi:D-beta-D-heptose 7-phosphate kinase/D-beta-D-heptose 1-phosphate adenosyltransferase